MKKLVIGLIVISSIFVVLPPIVGMQAQTKIENATAQFSTAAQNIYEVKIERYDRGWFNSQSRIRFNFTDAYIDANPVMSTEAPDGTTPYADMLREGITQEIEITHGPILFGHDFGLGIARIDHVMDAKGNSEAADVLKQVGNEYFMSTKITIGFDGRGSLVMHAPSMTYAHDADGEFIFAGADFEGSLDITDMHVKLDGAVHGVSVTDTQGDEYAMTPMKISVDMRYPESAPYGIGDVEFSLDRMLLLGNAPIDMQGLSFTAGAKEGKDGHIQFEGQYRIDKISSADTDFVGMNMGVSLANIRKETAKSLSDQYSNIQATLASDPEAAMSALSDPVYDLISDGAVLSLDPFNMTMDDRSLQLKLHLTAKPENLPERAAFTFSNPLMFMGLFKVDTVMSANRDLVIEMAMPQLKEQMRAGIPPNAQVDEAQLEQMVRNQAPVMIGALVGQGYIKEDGDLYTVEASFDNGELMLNGNPLPLGALLGGGQDLSSR